jgi:hypothetical protein
VEIVATAQNTHKGRVLTIAEKNECFVACIFRVRYELLMVLVIILLVEYIFSVGESKESHSTDKGQNDAHKNDAKRVDFDKNCEVAACCHAKGNDKNNDASPTVTKLSPVGLEDHDTITSLD